MKCHYDVLELARDADEAAIKSAYRKLALRWHPDKNLDNPDEAKAKFQVIQQAYEVLSDQQERAWYDRHRDQILRGSDNYTDDALDVFQYFTVTCYRGFTDTAGSFYSVYREIFERLAAEDLEFIDSDDSDDGSRIPGFGRSDSDYESVVGPFYAYWMAYSTRKTFAWLCPHNVAEIRDRRILRHVEKETGKLAQKARKERNDEVRALVAFVKKRDRRVVEWRRVLEQRAEQNRLKQEEKRLEQIRRNRAEVEEQMRVQKEAGGSHLGQADYEAKLRQMEAAYGRDSDESEESDYEDEEEEEEESVDAIGERLEKGATIEDDPDQAQEAEEEEVYIDHLYCVACNKAFKNESSMQNHQSSKKHKDNIEKLRLQMLDEEDAHNAANNESSSSSESEQVPAVSNKQSKKARRKAQKVNKPASASDEEEDETEPAVAAAVEPSAEVPEDVASVKDEAAEDEADANPTPLTKKSKRRAKKTIDPNTPQSKPSATVTSKSGRNQRRQQLGSSDDDDDDDHDDWSDQRGRGGGRGGSGGKAPTKAAARKAAAATAARKPAIEEIDETVDIDHTCVTCAAVFDSKNKLFAHLKKQNHGVYIEGKGLGGARAAVAAATAAAAAAEAAAGQARGGKGRRK